MAGAYSEKGRYIKLILVEKKLRPARSYGWEQKGGKGRGVP